MFFKMDEFNRDSSEGKRWSIIFLSTFKLTPEKVNSIHVCLKMTILCLPPFSILLFGMIFGYSVLLAYILFPFFAIKVAIIDVYVALFKSSKSKLQTAEERCLGSFCGLQFMKEEDIMTMKTYEVFYEAFPQAMLAIYFYLDFSVERSTLILVSICMSIGSIIISSIGYYVHSGKLQYGKDIYKRPCLIIKIIWFTHYITFMLSVIGGVFFGIFLYVALASFSFS